MAIGLELSDQQPTSANWQNRLIDCGLIAIVFAAWAAGPPPDVNEAHYLTKARQFWQPDWLPRDLFLTSSFPHWLFYFLWGWLTVVFDFDTAAWIGRIFGWILLAVGWESLATSLGLPRLGKLASAVCVVALTHWCNLSGEWMVGGIEAKVPAYAMVLLGLSAAISQSWTRVWVLLGFASGFHVLVGGWALCICLPLRIWYRGVTPITSKELVGLVAGLVILGLAMLPAIPSEWLTDKYTRWEAARIQVKERLSHHLYFLDFSPTNVLCFCLMLFGWCELARGTNDRRYRFLHAFAAGSLFLVGCGIILSWISSSSFGFLGSLLRFYWFRLADIAIPIAVAFSIARIVVNQSRSKDESSTTKQRGWTAQRWLALSAVGIAAVACGVTVAERWIDGRPGADRQSLPEYSPGPKDSWGEDAATRTRDTQVNWVRVCRWIKANTPHDALFLTPRNQQTFKWNAQRAEYANWKDAPQDALSLRAWSSRMNTAYGDNGGELDIENLPASWFQVTDVQFVVIEQAVWEQMKLRGTDAGFTCVCPANSKARTTYVVLAVDENR